MTEREWERQLATAKAERERPANIVAIQQKQIERLLAERDEARAACAEMRVVLDWKCDCQAMDDHNADCSFKHRMAVSHAISTDCGKGWISPEVRDQIIVRLRFIRDECDHEGDSRIAEAVNSALAILNAKEAQ